MRKIFRITVGIILVLLGLIGLALPLVPQWPLLIPGLLLLAEYFRPARQLLNWAGRKLQKLHPGLARKMEMMYPDAFREPEETCAGDAKMKDRL